jgi:hypothetical protein
MKSSTLGRLLVIAVLALGAAGAQATNPVVFDQLETDLIAAAQRAGVPIDTSNMFAVLRPDMTFVGATVQGFERIPATQLPLGVDYGFAYICVPDLPADYYTLRVFADEVQLGRIDGTLQLINVEGDVVSEMEAEIRVFSLQVPRNPPFANTVISGALDIDGEGYLSLFPWYICPNGWLVCFRRPIVKLFEPRD